MNQLGRQGEEGRKGIRILAPMIGTRKKDTEKTQESTITRKPVLVGYRPAYAFDISRTESAELPNLTEGVQGDVGEYRERPIDFTIEQGVLMGGPICG